MSGQRLEHDPRCQTILVVEDDDDIATLTRMFLEESGYHVIVARNGQEAITSLQESNATVDLVLLDLSMPIMDGSHTYPVLKQLRPEVKVLIFTGYDLNVEAQELIAAGANGFLNKFSTKQEMQEAISSALA